MTLMSAMIQRNITILHQDFQWTVDNMEDDIVMAYVGDNVFVQTKRDVGKYICLVLVNFCTNVADFHNLNIVDRINLNLNFFLQNQFSGIQTTRL